MDYWKAIFKGEQMMAVVWLSNWDAGIYNRKASFREKSYKVWLLRKHFDTKGHSFVISNSHGLELFYLCSFNFQVTY